MPSADDMKSMPRRTPVPSAPEPKRPPPTLGAAVGGISAPIPSAGTASGVPVVIAPAGAGGPPVKPPRSPPSVPAPEPFMRLPNSLPPTNEPSPLLIPAPTSPVSTAVPKPDPIAPARSGLASAPMPVAAASEGAKADPRNPRIIGSITFP